MRTTLLSKTVGITKLPLCDSVFNLLQKLVENRFMIQNLVIRDIRARYIGSFIGIFWSVIHPFSQLLIYYFIFSVLLRVKLGPEYGGTHFAIWLLAGLLPWMLFSEIVSRAPNAVLEQAGLIKKTVFPSEILSFSHFVAGFINHLISLIILMAFVGFLGGHVSSKVFFVFLYLIAIGIFAIGLSWILSSLNVFLRDIGQVLSVFINIWFYLTPVIYPASLIPEQYHFLMKLNPMFHAVEGYRMSVLGEASPTLSGLFYLLMTGCFFIGIGGVVFKKLKPAFADVL